MCVSTGKLFKMNDHSELADKLTGMLNRVCEIRGLGWYPRPRFTRVASAVQPHQCWACGRVQPCYSLFNDNSGEFDNHLVAYVCLNYEACENFLLASAWQKAVKT